MSENDRFQPLYTYSSYSSYIPPVRSLLRMFQGIIPDFLKPHSHEKPIRALFDVDPYSRSGNPFTYENKDSKPIRLPQPNTIAVTVIPCLFGLQVSLSVLCMLFKKDLATTEGRIAYSRALFQKLWIPAALVSGSYIYFFRLNRYN